MAQGQVLQLDIARERKIEDRVARSVVRDMSIGGENYERSIIPLRSDISRFSRCTGALFRRDQYGSLRCDYMLTG